MHNLDTYGSFKNFAQSQYITPYDNIWENEKMCASVCADNVFITSFTALIFHIRVFAKHIYWGAANVMSHVSVEQYHDFNQNNVLLAFFKASFIYRFPMKFKVYFTCLKFHAWDFSKKCILYLRDCKTIVMAFVKYTYQKSNFKCTSVKWFKSIFSNYTFHLSWMHSNCQWKEMAY